jgi:outer membrane protein
MKKTLVSLAVIATSIASQHALAYEPGDMFVRAGLVNVSPDAGSDGVAIPALGVDPINGTSVDVDDNTQLGLTLNYMVGSDWGIEVLAATPFTHDISADLSAAGFGVVPVGETSHLPPTVSAVWYFMGSKETFKPYVGAGVNYTTFFDTKTSAQLEAGVPAIARALTGGAVDLGDSVPLGLDLEDSWGLALQFGADFEINDNWHINGSIRWIDINTDAKITNRDLGTVITVDNVEIDPWVYQVNVGYKF